MSEKKQEQIEVTLGNVESLKVGFLNLIDKHLASISLSIDGGFQSIVDQLGGVSNRLDGIREILLVVHKDKLEAEDEQDG